MFPVFQTSTSPYRFVIWSETGRYISAVNGALYHEVTFAERLAGKFQILGYQELNGGEAALAQGKPGPIGVFMYVLIWSVFFESKVSVLTTELLATAN